MLSYVVRTLRIIAWSEKRSTKESNAGRMFCVYLMMNVRRRRQIELNENKIGQGENIGFWLLGFGFCEVLKVASLIRRLTLAI